MNLANRTHAMRLVAFGALMLAALGIYGVLSYSVGQRTKEIGLRMALGGNTGTTLWLVVRKTMVMILVGVGVGLGASALLARSMDGVLYGVSPFDLPSFASAAAVLVVAGLAASLVPAHRATRVDPMVALRDQ